MAATQVAARAFQRSTRQSPYKMRLVVDEIRGKMVNEALAYLPLAWVGDHYLDSYTTETRVTSRPPSIQANQCLRLPYSESQSRSASSWRGTQPCCASSRQIKDADGTPEQHASPAARLHSAVLPACRRVHQERMF